MQFLDFETIANYFQEKIDMTVYNLQERGELLPDLSGKPAYRFAFYVNKGDYHKAIKDVDAEGREYIKKVREETNALKDRQNPVIPVLIKNGGGIQDPSTSIDIYLQKVEFEIYGWCDRVDPVLDQWHDVELIFSTLCSELKGYTDTLEGHTIKLDMSDYPVFNELENKHFLALLNSNIHIIFGSHLSNLDKIVINGIEVPYVNFTEDFTQELIPDNKVTTEIKYMPNVYNYQFAMTGLYVKSNDVVNIMVEACSTGDLYAQPFGVDIVRNGEVLASRTMYVRNFKTIRSFGSIVAYDVSFYPAYTGD